MNVFAMSTTDRLGEILLRSERNFGPDVRAAINSLRSPTNLAILAGTLVLWVGSHLFGVGEILDVVLLTVGAFSIGWSIGDVAKDLYTFADLTMNARDERDLDRAAGSFSHAVVLAGITVVMAILLRRSVREISISRGPNVIGAARPRNPGLPAVGPDPEPGRLWSRPGVSSNSNLPAGTGSTSPFGEVSLSSAGSATEQALVRAHELVHQALTPRFGPLRAFRVQLGMVGYLRSALLQYIEEALAETVAQVRVNGAVIEGLRFPVANGYMTVTDLASEGVAIGTVLVGTAQFSVQFIPTTHDADTVANSCHVAQFIHQ